MREVKFEELEELWAQNKYPTMLYIHSPFCKSVCKYCCYCGCLKDENYDKYFNEYLVDEVKKFKGIIKKQDIKNIYFGGGTPNYEKDLRNLIPVLEEIKDIECTEKTIELHTGLEISSETIEVIKKYGFTTVILCVQTFDKEVLKREGRISEYTEISVVKDLINKFHEAGINVGMDLLYFPEDGIESLERDLELLTHSNIDEISIATIYKDREDCNKKELLDCIKNWAFRNDYASETPLNSITAFNEIKCIRLYGNNVRKLHNDKKFYSFLNYLDDISVPWERTSIIGIGDYKNKYKDTYSIIYNKCHYYTKYDGGETKYIIGNEISFYDKMRALINWMEQNSEEEPPVGVTVTIEKKMSGGINYYNETNQMCNFNIQDASYGLGKEFIGNLNEILKRDGKDSILNYLGK